MMRAGALQGAIEAMMHEDPERRWDMATSASRLERIASGDVTAVMPAAGPDATQVMAARPVDATQRLEATAPAAPAPASQVRRPEPAGQHQGHDGAFVPTPGGGRNGRRRLPLVFAALLVAVLGVAFLFSQLGDQGGTPAVGGTAPTVTPQAETPKARARQTRVPPARIPQTTTEPSTASPTGSATTDGPAPDAASRLEEFVRSYYSEVTQDTARTWPQLTPRMQGAAGGREGYDGFWRSIDSVNVNQARADASGREAVVNLIFRKNDGSTSTETHQLTFVPGDDGAFLIDSDRRQ